MAALRLAFPQENECRGPHYLGKAGPVAVAVRPLQQFQQLQKKTVADVMTWTRCVSLYIAVMARKKAELVPAMIAHMHAVLKLQQSVGGMMWLHYDWRSRREMNAEGHTTWGRRDPWQLLSVLSGKGIADDPFDIPPQAPLPPAQPQQQQTTGRAANTTRTPAGRSQPYNGA